MTVSRRNLDRISLFLLVLGLLVVCFRFVPQFRAAVLVASGRSANCPLGLAMDSENMIRQHMDSMSRIQKQTRLAGAEGDLELWETPAGPFWVPKGSGTILPSLLAEQERKIYGLAEAGARPGDIVLDCGAHVGVYTREALRAGARLVVAIEPAPLNIESLRRNFAKEIAEGKVIVYGKGVWDREDTLSFHVDPGNSAGHAIDAHGEIKIPVTTIDALAKELNLAKVDFIKMDIEGSEQKALAGAASTLKQFRPRMAICTYHVKDDPVMIPKVVASILPSYQYECGPCGEQDFRIIPHTLLFR